MFSNKLGAISVYKFKMIIKLPIRQPVPGSEIVVKSRSVKRNEKNARELGRDGAAEPVRIFLTACSGILAPDIPSDWSIVTVNIIT